MLLGISIEFRLKQQENIASLIYVNCESSWKVTLVRPVEQENKSFPILVTLLGITNE
jgi:hypothetical protein